MHFGDKPKRVCPAKEGLQLWIKSAAAQLNVSKKHSISAKEDQQEDSTSKLLMAGRSDILLFFSALASSSPVDF